MLNQALLDPKRHLNQFTSLLRARCAEQGHALARLRNGQWCEVRWRNVPDGADLLAFCTAGGARQWHADGSSDTSPEFDLVETPTPRS